MKELTPEERSEMMAAVSAAFSKVFSYAHENGWDGKFYYNFQYLFHGYEDKAWFTMWGVVDGCDTAIDMNTPDLFAHFRDDESKYMRESALTIENVHAAADKCIKEMEFVIEHYDELAAEFRAKKGGRA